MYRPSVRKMSRYAAYAGYHRFINKDAEVFGSFEVFFVDTAFADPNFPEETCGPGWYWVACFPGCMPDGSPNGPHTSSRAAWRDARDNS